MESKLNHPLNSSSPTCPSCGMSEYRKAGKNSHNKRQMLKCRKCGRYWTLDESVNLSIIETGLQNLRISSEDIIPNDVLCVRCQSSNIRLAGWFSQKAGNIRRARCVDCNKYFPAPELNHCITLDCGHVERHESELKNCPRCGGGNIGSGGINSDGNKLAVCRTCDKRWVVQSTKKEELPQLVCPSCSQKDEFIKGGFEDGFQKYICQKCLTRFLPLREWQPKCPSCGSMRFKHRGRNTQSSTKPYYTCLTCNTHYSQDSKPEIDNDPYVIDFRLLGLHMEHHQGHKINLSNIRPLWLREAILKYTKIRVGQGSWKFSTAKEAVSAITVFGKHLEMHYPGIQCQELTRQVMLEVMTSNWWITWNVSSKKRLLGILSSLQEAIDQNGWDQTSKCRLVFPEDYPRRVRIKSRFIPEIVMDKIIDNLPSLPLPFQRAILVLAEVGMRFSELAGLKQGCINQDIQGNWWLTYRQYKMDKDHRIPISKNCAFAIQEQTKFVFDLFGKDFNLVFCGRATCSTWRPKRLSNISFNRAIQSWTKDYGISNSNGKIWHLTTHQFRHTVATRMINAGVAQHYVQKYLGHETSQMTQHYAHLHDQTLRDAFDKYYDGKVTDIKGTVYEPSKRSIDSVDLQWFRSNIQGQALPNGSCSLPTVAQSCPHANACLTCTHFRTSKEHLEIHKGELKKTEEILIKAQENGWARQVEMNEKVAVNLRKIISTLENA